MMLWMFQIKRLPKIMDLRTHLKILTDRHKSIWLRFSIDLNEKTSKMTSVNSKINFSIDE